MGNQILLPHIDSWHAQSDESPIKIIEPKFLKSSTGWYLIKLEWEVDKEKAAKDTSYKYCTLSSKGCQYSASNAEFSFPDNTHLEIGIQTADTTPIQYEYAYHENLGYGMWVYFKPKENPHGDWEEIPLG